MAGLAQVEWQGRDIDVRRFAVRGSPFGGFEAVYTVAGDPVPGLTGVNVGEALTGAAKETYLHVAFVGAGGALIGRSGELEARIAALATAGEEDVSYSETVRTLKDWRNRRRANRAVGQIPELERKLSETEETLRELGEAERRREAAAAGAQGLAAERAALEKEMEAHARCRQWALDRRYTRAAEQWRTAEAAVPSETEDARFSGMSADEAWAWAQEQERAAQAAREQRRAQEAQLRQLEEARRACAGQKRRSVAAGGLLLLAAAVLGLCRLTWPVWAACLCGAAVLALLCLRARRGESRAEQALGVLVLTEVPSAGPGLEAASAYRAALSRREEALRAADASRRLAEELRAQGGRELPEGAQPPQVPQRSPEETRVRLEYVQRELLRCQEEQARAEGALVQIGRMDALEARRDALREAIEARTQELEAIDQAIECLGCANTQLRERFSPALNREAGEIFSALTGGRWSQLSLARDFEAWASREGDTLPRAAAALSAGTVQQLYLAVRLAICRLTLPDAPVFLDDALALFDDGRMEQTMAVLQKMGQERQILLFSCQEREARWAQAHGVPVVRLG